MVPRYVFLNRARLETTPLQPGTVNTLEQIVRENNGVNLTGIPNANLFVAYPPNLFDKN